MDLARAARAAPETAESVEKRRRFGDFLLVRRLGTGPLGMVHEAVQESTGRRVALKRWSAASPPSGAGPEGLLPWPAAGLRHPRIMTVYAHGQRGDTVWVAMEFHPEGSLGGRIEAGRHGRGEASRVHEADRRRSEERLTQVFAATARGLDEAHRSGIVHGGIKPENLLFSDDGQRLLLSDFAPANGTALGAVSWLCELGTGSRYAAPEQLMAPESGGPWSDVYALGACLVAALMPEHAASRAAPAARAAADPPWAVLPAALRTVLRDCLVEDPQRRPTAAEVAEALGAPFS